MSDDISAKILAAIHGITERLDRLEAGQTNLQSTQAAGQAELLRTRTEVTERLDRVDARLDRLEAGQTNLQSTQTAWQAELSRTRADVMDRIDRLQDVLTVQQEGVDVDISAGERAERLARNAQEDIRSFSEQMAAMVRQIHRLQTDVRQLRGDP